MLFVLSGGPARLSEMRRLMPNASKKGLTASLRALELARIITRRDLSTAVLHVEYELTPAANEPTIVMLTQIADWAGLCCSSEPTPVQSGYRNQTRINGQEIQTEENERGCLASVLARPK